MKSDDESFDDSHAITLGATGSGAFSRVLKPGELIGGTYRIKSLLGKGGMGYVFCAEHTMIKREYALKMLAPEQLNEASKRRFEIEGKAIANLNHPSIVKVYNMGLDNGYCPFYVMDLLDGMALSDCISTGEEIAFEQCLDIFSQIASGLGYAHGKGIVHRDVKPSNIILLAGSEGRRSVKIVDFGIAKLLPSADLYNQSQTATGQVFGSPLYMSPEQCMGSAIDHRSDIYSLGCTFFEVLCRRPPFRGHNAMETVMMHQNNATPSILEAFPEKGLPRSVDLLLTKMMAKRPEDRYQSMEQLRHDLERVKSGKTIGKASGRESSGESSGDSSGDSSEEISHESAREHGRAEILNNVGHGGNNWAFWSTVGMLGLLVGGALIAVYPNPEITQRRQAGQITQVSPGVSQPGSRSDSRPVSQPSTVTRGLHSNHPGPGTIDKASPELHDQKGARGLDEPVYESEEQWAPAPDGDLPKAREAFKNCRSIKSTIVTRNGIRQKMFVFPDFPIGRIFNVDMGMIEAKGVKYTPITKELILEIGFHRSRQVLYCPEIVDTIDPGEFAGLMLAGNGVSALIGQFVPARQPSVGVVHILKVASGWSKIELLRLDALSLTSMVLAPINDFKHLKSLEIDKPIINTQDLARQPFLCQIKELIFTRFNEQDRMAPICRKLASSDKLQRLQFVSCNVTSDDLLALRACPKLLYLDLEGENMLQLVPAVIQLPHLQEVCFRNAKLSTEQIASITTRKNILRLILSEKEYSESERAQCRYNSHKVSFAKR